MTVHWRTPLLLLFTLVSHSLVFAQHSFENTNIVRSVDLGGSLVHVTTTYTVKALEDGAGKYAIVLPAKEVDVTSFLEVKVKGTSETLHIHKRPLTPPGHPHLYTVDLPKALHANGTINLVLETVQTHATYPWPQTATQKEPQNLKYETELFVLSPYKTTSQRTKIRAPSPAILSYTTPEVSSFVGDSVATKSGATITYGPFHDIPESSIPSFVDTYQKPLTIHYPYEFPVLEITKLERAAEISHWGANLNIHNNFWLHNAGPTLKGHFARIDYQAQNFMNQVPAHILPSLTLHLPPGIHSAYFYDLNGNVSTSHLRPAPSVPKAATSNQYSLLEMRPRYPLMGGWNYSFSLGWDSPLKDSAGYDASTGKYVVGVPVQTVVPSAVVDDAEVKIIFPEGATDIEIFPPFPALSQGMSTHITYLDTVGRPTATFHYQNLTDKHSGIIYATYKVPFSAHVQKPKAVATAFIGLFAFALLAKRVDYRLTKP